MKKNFLIILASSLIILIIFVLFSSNKPDIGDIACPCNQNDFSGLVQPDEKLAYFEGKEINIPALAYVDDPKYVLSATSENRWIEVDLSEQKLKAWEGSNLFLETKVSSGLPRTPTPTGEFRIWVKLRATKMSGGSGRYYYYLPNVPYVMYFSGSGIPNWKGYGLHGTYWHNDFGTPRSHGCVNLPTNIAKELYYWVSPILTGNKTSIYASDTNLGTRIVIHE